MTTSREPLAVEFANTVVAVRGRLRDGIATPDELDAWLRAHATALGAGDGDPAADAPPTAAEVTAFVSLRDAVRALVRAAAEGAEASVGTEASAGAAASAGADGTPVAEVVQVVQVREADVAAVNAAAAAAPAWPVLRFGEQGFSADEATGHPRIPAALATLARGTVTLLSGPTRADLRACHAPGCVQFFVKDHPRREWCSAACGNRARAARHYQRHRED